MEGQHGLLPQTAVLKGQKGQNRVSALDRLQPQTGEICPGHGVAHPQSPAAQQDPAAVLRGQGGNKHTLQSAPPVQLLP